MKNSIVMLVVATLFVACGTSHEGAKATFSSEVLTAEEIATTSAITAYDAVRIRRPTFLAVKGPKSVMQGPRSTTKPVVYLNDLYYGELETLQNISAVDVKEIRYVDPRTATISYGTGHVAGVILVITKK
ncbi:MAG: hypothetical protein HY276_10285 [Ignavibacteriales bacterium]|nr:hypothetical protein [Ignavibacteriales bacterium]